MSASTVALALPALPTICREHGVRGLDIFGFAATGGFDPARGDIDILAPSEAWQRVVMRMRISVCMPRGKRCSRAAWIR